MGAPRDCLDIDECETNPFGMNGCGEASQFDCTNQQGADPVCQDNDGCEVEGGYNDCGLATLRDCVNQDGASTTCTDRNECLVDNGGCDGTYQDCINRLATCLPRS